MTPNNKRGKALTEQKYYVTREKVVEVDLTLQQAKAFVKKAHGTGYYHIKKDPYNTKQGERSL